MRSRAWRWTRRAGAGLLLALIVWRFGTGPFLAGIRAVRLDALLAAVAITALTTVCSAWRWRIVSRSAWTCPSGPRRWPTTGPSS